MKNLMLLPFLLLFTSATCQEPDTHTYSQNIIDSLNMRIQLLEFELNVSETSVIADTFNFEIIDDRIKVEVNKQGHNVWVNIIDGQKRINADYINYTRQIVIMDSTFTVGSMYIR
jgi:hypothetical protein